MALTRDQWFEKLKSWVPGWFFDIEENQVAVFNAISKVLSEVQADSEEMIAQTYISTSSGEYLDLHGSERSITRNINEADSAYSVRVRIATNTATELSMKQLSDSTLNNGECQMIDNKKYGFWDDELFYDLDSSRWLDGMKNINYMTLIIPVQTAGDLDAIRTSLNSVIEDNKALGVIFEVFFQT